MNQPTRKPASNASPAPVVSVAWIGVGRNLEAQPRITFAGKDRGALGAALHDRDRGHVQQTVDRVLAQQTLGLRGGREQDVGGDVRDEPARRPATASEQRADRREVEADRSSCRTTELDRPSAAVAERLIEERIERQVNGIRAGEPRRLQVGRLELERRRAVGHEGSFAVGRHDDTDPPRPSAGHADHARRHAIGTDDVDEGPAGRIPADRGDQRCSCPQTAEPPRCRRRRPALREEHPTGDVGPVLERAVRPQDDVDHEVAHHHDPRPARRAARGDADEGSA